MPRWRQARMHKARQLSWETRQLRSEARACSLGALHRLPLLASGISLYLHKATPSSLLVYNLLCHSFCAEHCALYDFGRLA